MDHFNFHNKRRLGAALAACAALGFFLASSAARAATITWTGGGADNNWTTAGNWSSGVPTTTDVALFSASSSKNATVNGTTSVLGISIASGYGGIISQGTSSFTLGTSGWSQVTGTFTGAATATITVNGPFSLTGGTFTSTGGNLLLTDASTTFTGGTFQDGGGYAIFAATTTSITGSSTFYNLDFLPPVSGGNTSTVSIASGTILTVKRKLNLNGDGVNYAGPSGATLSLGGGEIDVTGDIGWGAVVNASTSAVSTTSIVMNGTTSQTIYGDATGTMSSAAILTNMTFGKSSGTLSLAGYITFAGTGGTLTRTTTSTIDAGTSTVVFAANTFTVSENNTSTPWNFYDLAFINPANNGVTAGNSTISFGNNGTTATVLNRLGILGFVSNSPIVGAANSNITLNSGEIQVVGSSSSVSFGNNMGASSGGSLNVALVGAGTQDIDGGNRSAAYFPSLTVNKPTGTIAYIHNQGNMYIEGFFKVSAGELRVASDSAVTAPNGVGLTVVSSTQIFSGAALSMTPTVNATLTLSAQITNNGLMYFDGGGSGCTRPWPNYVKIRSVDTSQRLWYGSGTFILRYVDLQKQNATNTTPTPLSVSNGTDSGSNTQFTFNTVPRTEMIQSVTNSGTTSTLALPAFGFAPRVGNAILVAVSARKQNIAAPTDSAGNTYTLVASSTFNGTPTYALSLYYAKNIVSTTSLVITAYGTSSQASPFLSASAFEYADLAPSSTFDVYNANTSYPATSTNITSNTGTGSSGDELFFGTMTMDASTTASSTSGWNARSGVADNTNSQALYVQDYGTSTSGYATSAVWTAATSTSYAAILGIFRSPYINPYAASGTVDSATFDTGVASGTQLNSVIWQGVQPAGTYVKFQFAASNASSGPWNYVGPDGTANTYFGSSGQTVGAPIGLVSTSNGYSLLNGYRYFRYRITLFADPTLVYSPTVRQVTVNWSP